MPSFLGMGLTNGSHIYVPIPKVASSSHRVMFQSAGWKKLYFGSDAWDKPAYIPIRNPIERWYSGAYQRSRRPGRPSVENQIDRAVGGVELVLDENTMKQSDFVLSSLHKPRLVKLENAQDYVDKSWGLELPEVNRNPDPITHLMGRRPKLIDWIIGFYWEDMELYERAL